MRSARLLITGFAVLALVAGCGQNISGSASVPSTNSSDSLTSTPATRPPVTSEVSAATAQTQVSVVSTSEFVTQTQTAASFDPTAATTTVDVSAPAPSEIPPSVPSTDPTETAVPVTDLAGEVYGFITAIDTPNSQITIDKIDWFSGAAAAAACAEDGVTEYDNNRCTGWYYRNVNPKTRVVTVSPDAQIELVNSFDSTRPEQPGRFSALSQRLEYYVFIFTVTDGQVVAMKQVYLP